MIAGKMWLDAQIKSLNPYKESTVNLLSLVQKASQVFMLA